MLSMPANDHTWAMARPSHTHRHTFIEQCKAQSLNVVSCFAEVNVCCVLMGLRDFHPVTTLLRNMQQQTLITCKMVGILVGVVSVSIDDGSGVLVGQDAQ